VSSQRSAVYSAVMGGYEQLREEPLAASSDADFVCFTDDPEMSSDTWQVVVVEPRFATDPIRSARYLKICGHPALTGYDRTLWVDNSVELLAPPEDFLDEWLTAADVAAPLHSTRTSLFGEAEAILDIGKDDHVRVYEQLQHYARISSAALEANPHWTGMLARRRTPEVTAVMQTWWEHVLRFSRRDQLSFSMVMSTSSVRLRSVSLPNLESPLHRWPRAMGRSERSGDAIRDALRPPVSRIRDLELALDQVRLEAAAREVETAELVLDGERVVAELTTDRDRLVVEIEKLQEDAHQADERIRALGAEIETVKERAKRLRHRLRRQRDRRRRVERQLDQVLARRGWRPR
jgi:FtsZ-binding cell division protein ZapB